MDKRVFNIVATVIVIIIIAAFTINYYNTSKLDGDNINSGQEVLKKKDSSNKKDDNNKNDDSGDTDTKQEETENDDKDEELKSSEEVDSNDNKDDELESDDKSGGRIEGEEIAVSSTSSFENVYIYLVGGIIIILGTGSIVFKYNYNK